MAYASRRQRSIRFLSCEELETRLCLSEVSFASHVIIEGQTLDRSVYATDVDGDGDVDVLSASGDDDKIAWYENIDGAGTFGPQRVITTAVEWAHSVHAADVDGDGDMDVLSVVSRPNGETIVWYENIDGKGAYGLEQVIGTVAAVGGELVDPLGVSGEGPRVGLGDLDIVSLAGRQAVVVQESLQRLCARL